MGLSIVNWCPDGVLYVAWMYLNNDCPHQAPYGGFEKNGWWVLNYQDSAEVVGGDLQNGGNEYYYFYAENSAGEVWNGDYFDEVSNPTFTQCSTDNANMTRTVGFFELDINGYDNYTFYFTCADSPPLPGTGTGTGTGDGTGDGWAGTGDGTGDGGDE
jgi:hypothetical protein